MTYKALVRCKVIEATLLHPENENWIEVPGEPKKHSCLISLEFSKMEYF